MYFLNLSFFEVGLVLFAAMMCGPVIKCDDGCIPQNTLLSFGTNGKSDDHFEWTNDVLSNETTNRLNPTSATGGGGSGGGDCRGCSVSAGLLRGLTRLLSVCGLSTECYGSRLLTALDRALDSDTLRLADGVYLVNEYRYEQRLETGVSDSEPFMTAFTRRLIMILETHALRVRLGVMKENVPQTRGLHRGYRLAFPLMVGAFMLLAAITVPMGFQFLAVVGGKALILSQIALYLALGGHFQRYFGRVAAPAPAPAPVGGFVQHDYYIRNDSPWQRDSVDVEAHHQPQHKQQGYISHQQLQGYMNQRA